MSTENKALDPLEIKIEAHRKIFDELNEVSALSLQAQFLIALVFLGFKPAAEINIFVYKDNNFDNDEDVQKVTQALSKLGLSYIREINEPEDEFDDPTTNVTWYVSTTQTAAQKLMDSFKNSGGTETGKLLGFPDTAIKAFPEKSINELPEEAQSSWEKNFVYFRPSKAHWKAEFDFVGKQAMILKKYLPELFEQIVRESN